MMLKNIMISSLAVIFALFYLMLNLTVYTNKRYNFQPKRIEYDWGYLTFTIHPTMQDKVKGVYVYGNPYGIALSVYSDYSMTCKMELKQLSLKRQDKTPLYMLNEKNLTEGIVEKENRKSFYVEQVISITYYKTIYGAFKMNIICDGEILETIEEKEIVLNTNYIEESKTVLEVLGSQ